jgi:sugar phosphate isomerase/epimerase
MKRAFNIMVLISALTVALNGQKVPTGNPKDFKVKTCLHSVSYMGVWRGQATLTVDEFLIKAKELGFDGVMLAAKRPHVSLIDYDDAERKKLRARIKELGLELVCLAGYCDFTAGVDKAGIPNVEIEAVYVGELARLASDLGTNMVRVYTGYERPDLPYDKQYAMKPYIVHTTTADYKELPRFKYEHPQTNYVQLESQMRAVPMGTGFLDYKTFISTLKEIGYQGYIAYEMCEVLEGGGSIENLDRCAKAFLEYIKQFK